MVTLSHFKKGDAIPELPKDGKLVLFSMRFCPYAQRIHHVLDAKNIPHNSVYINLSEKPEWLTKFSPTGKVPSLGLENEPGKPFIYESLLIADYLEEKYPEIPLYPKEPLAKIQQRLLIDRFSGVFASTYKLLLSGKNDEEFEKLLSGLDGFEEELTKLGSSFFSGSEEPEMVDYMIFPFYERIAPLKYTIGDDYVIKADRFPNLSKWDAKMIAHPVVAKIYLNGEVHAEFLKGRMNGNADYDLLLK